jgi:hypothetical protein
VNDRCGNRQHVLVDLSVHARSRLTVEPASRPCSNASPLLPGLPGDSCPCPHRGYVLKGRLTYRFADHDEVFDAGDAFYLRPGHVPVAEAGSELVRFSPAQELLAVDAVMLENVQDESRLSASTPPPPSGAAAP